MISLVAADRNCEIRTPVGTQITPCASVGVLNHGVSGFVAAKDLARAEGDTNAALLAPSLIDLNLVHCMDHHVISPANF